MNTLFYPAVFHPEKTGYSVYIPDVEGCVSEGDTLEEAYENIFDALGLCLESFRESGKPFPTAANPANMEKENDDFIVIIPFA